MAERLAATSRLGRDPARTGSWQCLPGTIAIRCVLRLLLHLLLHLPQLLPKHLNLPFERLDIRTRRESLGLGSRAAPSGSWAAASATPPDVLHLMPEHASRLILCVRHAPRASANHHVLVRSAPLQLPLLCGPSKSTGTDADVSEAKERGHC